MSHIYQHRSLVPISSNPRGSNGTAPSPAAAPLPPPARDARDGRATPLNAVPVPAPGAPVAPGAPASAMPLAAPPVGPGVVVGMSAGHAPPPGSAALHAAHARLSDVFSTIRSEFDVLGQDNILLRSQRDEIESIMAAHVQEVRAMQAQVVELEKRHAQLVGQHKEEIKHLRMLVDQRPASSGFSPGRNPFSGPDGREYPPPRPRSPPHLPPSERRDDARLPPPEAKRMRMTEGYAWDQAVPSAPAPAPAPAPGPGPVPAPAPYPPEAARAYPPEPAHAPSPRDAPRKEEPEEVPPAPAAPARLAPVAAIETAPPSAAEKNVALAQLSDMDADEVPKALKTEGSDWVAIYNPNVPRRLKVNLVHTMIHDSVVCCVRFSLDGKYVATGCNRSAQIYDTTTGAKVAVLTEGLGEKGDDLYIRSVCFSPDGKYLATGAEDHQVRVWDIASRTVKHLLQGHEQEIYSLDWSLDGKIIASGSGDMTVRIWDVEAGTLLHTLSTGDTPGPGAASEAGVTSVSINADSRLVAAGALDTYVRVWDTRSAQQVECLEGHADSIYSVAFAPDGQSLVSGSLDKTVKRWDLSGTLARVHGRAAAGGEGVKVSTLAGHKDYVLSVACSPDGQWIASGSKDRGVMFWDPASAETQLVLQGHKNSVIAIHLSPAGGLLATGSGDFDARIWSYESVEAP